MKHSRRKIYLFFLTLVTTGLLLTPNLLLQPIKADQTEENSDPEGINYPELDPPHKDDAATVASIFINGSYRGTDLDKRFDIIAAEDTILDVWVYGCVYITVPYTIIGGPTSKNAVEKAEIWCNHRGYEYRDSVVYDKGNISQGYLELKDIYVEHGDTLTIHIYAYHKDDDSPTQEIEKRATVTIKKFDFVQRPPNKPETPHGPSKLHVNELGKFTTSGTDPDNTYYQENYNVKGTPDLIRFRFDWGDGRIDDQFSGVHMENYEYSEHQKWSTPGEYYIRAQAKDEPAWTDWGREGPKIGKWSDKHLVKVRYIFSGNIDISVSSDVIFDMINPDNNTNQPMETNDTIYGNITGYFIDIDGDGIWDLFHITNITFPDNVIDYNQIYYDQDCQTQYNPEDHTYDIDFNSDGTTDANVNEDDIPEPQTNNA